MEQPSNFSTRRKLVPRPVWLVRFERRLARAIPIHPHWLSAAKLLLVAPALLLALGQIALIPGGAAIVSGLMLAFFALDYLDGLVARERGCDTWFGRVFDRVTDYPLLLVVSFFCIDIVPVALIAAKIAIDVLLLLLFVLGRGSTENRLRTAMSYTAVLALLCLSQGWAPTLVTATSVEYLLWINIAFSSTVALYNMDILRKRYFADLLSLANLLCGACGIAFAIAGRLEVSLMFLLLGAAFDGFDGYCARRYGSSRWGVYSDDVADGVNFGLAPAVAIYCVLGGGVGAVLGALYVGAVVIRLVFFTLNKTGSDPNYFSGVPSPVGGVVALCTLILFGAHPAVVGSLIGAISVLMISFDSAYRHLGRALARHKRSLYGAPVLLMVLLFGAALWGVRGPVAIILAVNLSYCLIPMARKFWRVARSRRAQRDSRVGYGQVAPSDEIPSV